MSGTAKDTQAVAASGTFEPKLVAFVCKWCTYAGADLAGTSRMAYPANVQAIMLPCTGRIDISFVIKAFLQGADGVVVSGCHPGDCHYTAGNFRARRRWTLLRDLFDTIGFDLRRVQFAWISAAEGAKWVKMIEAFTHTIRDLGPYSSMKETAFDHTPAAAPNAGQNGNGHAASAETVPLPAPPELIEAANHALQAGEIRALVCWKLNRTLGKVRPGWITSVDELKDLVIPQAGGNLARFIKNPALPHAGPIGIVAREDEQLALNVLLQEAQVDAGRVVVFGVDENGQFSGKNAAGGEQAATFPDVDRMSGNEPVGFAPETLKALDDLMAKSPEERWAFWSEQFKHCIKCYACRQSCPMCNCDQCFADKNQPQWFPTAADGAGNFAWHVMRAFHLAGRCIGCGACESACPAHIPINLLSAAMGRSAYKNFGFLAGVSPTDPPLQAAFRAADTEAFIL